MTNSVEVKHRSGTYSIFLVDMAELGRLLPSDAFIITDENVWSAWKNAITDIERVLVLPPGEQTKSLAYYEQVTNWLFESGADRTSTVVAFGGGVIGDLAGFAASTYMRGIKLIQAPTTLLSQVDSSVGGKVGIDAPGAKNVLGAFWPPHSVYVPHDALNTLPERQFRNGMAEVWKYGFIMDAALVEEFKESDLSPQSENLRSVIGTCISHKRKIVEEDEFDQTGSRAILNFGHTVGHALEQLTGYGPLLHGEAISIGMVAEALIGEAIGFTDKGTGDRIRGCLASAGLPVAHELFREPTALIEAMKRDKKAVGGELAMSLVSRVGECKLATGISQVAVEAVLRSI